MKRGLSASSLRAVRIWATQTFKRAVEIDRGLAPDFAAEAVAIDHLAGVARQHSQDLERLRREADERAVAPQFTCVLVELEDPEAQHPLRV